jgi:cytochrome c-type biogenesis protein CcmH
MMLLFTLLLLVALLPLLLALRVPRPLASRAGQDIAFHQQSLNEIAQRVRDGHLGKAEAGSLTLDVQRRLLRVRRDGGAQASEQRHFLIQLTCALLVIAAGAGWLVSGNRVLPEQPAAKAGAPPATDASIASALAKLNVRPDDEEAWLALSERFMARRESAKAVEALSVASAAMPDRVSLWVALGQALFLHGEGQMSPAARYAFDRAIALDPDHPGPKIFEALALLQQAQPQKALPILQALEARAPEDATWRPRVERMLRGARAMIAAGVGSEVSR